MSVPMTAADVVRAYARWFDEDLLSPEAFDHLCAAIAELNGATARRARRLREGTHFGPGSA